MTVSTADLLIAERFSGDKMSSCNKLSCHKTAQNNDPLRKTTKTSKNLLELVLLAHLKTLLLHLGIALENLLLGRRLDRLRINDLNAILRLVRSVRHQLDTTSHVLVSTNETIPYNNLDERDRANLLHLEALLGKLDLLSGDLLLLLLAQNDLFARGLGLAGRLNAAHLGAKVDWLKRLLKRERKNERQREYTQLRGITLSNCLTYSDQAGMVAPAASLSSPPLRGTTGSEGTGAMGVESGSGMTGLAIGLLGFSAGTLVRCLKGEDEVC